MLYIIKDASNALNHLYSNNLVHGCVTPLHIFISENGFKMHDLHAFKSPDHLFIIQHNVNPFPTYYSPELIAMHNENYLNYITEQDY